MKPILYFGAVIALAVVIAATGGKSSKHHATPVAPATPRSAYVGACAHSLDLAGFNQTDGGAAKSMCVDLARRHHLDGLSVGAASSLGGDDAYGLVQATRQ